MLCFGTLAVLAVNHFLGWMEFETYLDGSDSWNPAIRAVLDVADLVLPGIGKVECCPIQDGETAIPLPGRENRITYILVQFPDPLDKVKLLGFVPDMEIQDDTEEISGRCTRGSMLSIARPQGTNIFQLVIGTVLCFK